jgi:hypothetical protein
MKGVLIFESKKPTFQDRVEYLLLKVKSIMKGDYNYKNGGTKK